MAVTLLLVTAQGADARQSGENDAEAAVAPLRPNLREPVGVTAVDGLDALPTDNPPLIDGRMDEDVWSFADYALGFVQQVPVEGSTVSEGTEVRILLDRDALYVGARLADRDAAQIVTRLARRDEAVVADWFYVYVKSADRRRTNPRSR